MTKSKDEGIAALYSRVKQQAFHLESIGVSVSNEDKIVALTNRLEKTYDPVTVFLDMTPANQLMLNHIID